MEKHFNYCYRNRKPLLLAGLSAVALAGCMTDNHSNDLSNVQCDGMQIGKALTGDGTISFIVHGKEEGKTAVVKVRRLNNEASVGVTGDVTGPPQQLEADGFTKPEPIKNDLVLSAFGAGGAWFVDVTPDLVKIQGTCDGM